MCAQSAIMNKITTPKRKKNNNKSGSPTRVRMHADRYILNVQKRFLDPLHSGSNVAGVMMLDVPLKKHRPRRHTLLQTTFEMHPKISVCQGIYRNSSAFPRSQDKRVRISKKNLVLYALLYICTLVNNLVGMYYVCSNQIITY